MVMRKRFYAKNKDHNVVNLLEVLNQIKQFRIKSGLTLIEVEKRSEINKATLSFIENGKVINPTYSTLYRYAEAIGLEVKLSVIPRK